VEATVVPLRPVETDADFFDEVVAMAPAVAVAPIAP
jgi:hypothetical protein